MPDFKSVDDFVRTISELLAYLSWSGIAWNRSILQQLWSIFLIGSFIIYSMCCVSKLTNLRNFHQTTSLIGHFIIYFTLCITLLGFRRLRNLWPSLSALWTTTEYNMANLIKPDKLLRKRMLCVTAVSLFITILENILRFSVGSDFINKTFLEAFQQYAIHMNTSILNANNYTIFKGMFLSVITLISSILWNLREMVLILFSIGLTSKQRRVNKIIQNFCMGDTFMGSANLRRSRRIRENYANYMTLVRAVNNAIGPLIAMSCVGNMFFIVRSIYMGIDTRTYNFVPANERLLQTFSLVFLCVRTFIVLLTASNLNCQSQAALQYLKNVDTRNYNLEIRRLEFQIRKDAMGLNVMGYFTLNRTFILKAISTIITYELILAQYENRMREQYDYHNNK
uniref:Gustatory receptor n=1 Tax=Eogystia hippophaecolus TaxID=1206364 RepID=A0A1B3P5U7_EOGHI|nr:gustatory receptor [Eogystia hippophaecolus]